MVENVIIYPVNVHVLQVLQVHCAMIHAQKEHTAKPVNQNVNVKMMVNAILKTVHVNVRPVGREMFVQIDAQLDFLVCFYQ